MEANFQNGRLFSDFRVDSVRLYDFRLAFIPRGPPPIDELDAAYTQFALTSVSRV
jgi:hypothetical protein